jgi:hypothetical protein
MTKKNLTCAIVVGSLILLLAMFMQICEYVRSGINSGATKRLRVMTQIRDMYEEYYDFHHDPPRMLENLRPYAKLYPEGFHAIDKGQWILRLDVRFCRRSFGTTYAVLAYECSVPCEGGVVLMADGSGLRMGPEEFRQMSNTIAVAQQIWTMFHAYQKKSGTFPGGMNELLDYENEFRAAFKEIEGGRWVVLWNNAKKEHDGRKKQILAYKDMYGKEGDGPYLAILVEDNCLLKLSKEELQDATRSR